MKIILPVNYFIGCLSFWIYVQNNPSGKESTDAQSTDSSFLLFVVLADILVVLAAWISVLTYQSWSGLVTSLIWCRRENLVLRWVVSQLGYWTLNTPLDIQQDRLFLCYHFQTRTKLERGHWSLLVSLCWRHIYYQHVFVLISKKYLHFI